MRQYFLFVGKDITQVPMKEDGQQMADGMPSVNSIEHQRATSKGYSSWSGVALGARGRVN